MLGIIRLRARGGSVWSEFVWKMFRPNPINNYEFGAIVFSQSGILCRGIVCVDVVLILLDPVCFIGHAGC
jgi:hypothetical protein